MGIENGPINCPPMNVAYCFGVEDSLENDCDPNKKSRTVLVSCACSFCKKRHLKCDGQLPCSNCVAKKIEDQCCYPTQAKRGRKPGQCAKIFCIHEVASPQSVTSTELAAYKFSKSYKDTTMSETGTTEQNSRDANLISELMKYRQEAEFWKQQYFKEHEKCISLQLQVNAPKVMESSIQLMQLSATIFFRSAANKLQSILPFYVSVVDSDFPWHNYEGIRCDGYRAGSVSGDELCNAFEYSAICALGSIEHNYQTSMEFANKSEDLLYILFWKELVHKNEKLSSRLFKVLLLFTSYWWCNLNPMKAHLVSHLALLIWNCNRTIFPPLWCYQLFGVLATCSKSFDDRVRWLTAMRVAMEQMSEPAETLTCLQMAFATSLNFVPWSSPGSGVLRENEKQTLLLFLELLGNTYSGKWVVSERSRIVLAACKGVVFYFLGNEQAALEHCQEALQRMKTETVDMGILLALAACMKVQKGITKEDVPEEHRDIMKNYQSQYPVLRDLMNQMQGILPEFMKNLAMQIPGGMPPVPVDPWCAPPDSCPLNAFEMDSRSTPEQFLPSPPSSPLETESPPSAQDWQFLLAALAQHPGFNF